LSVIEVRNLTKYYGNFCAVNGISFSIREGEVVGFLGPNGAGKTTTIRVLTCFQPASAGSVTVAGHDVLTESMAVRSKVGYMPESVPLYQEMRVNEYLNFRGKIHGLERSARRRAVERVIERCWLNDVYKRPIAHLSKGFRQRVGLADALLHNPPVLVLDEPTIGLDPRQIRETRALIKGLAQDHTVLFSSHILPEVEATCQRLIIINKGQIVASGTPAELRARVTVDSDVVAEIKAPLEEVQASLRKVDGVRDVHGTNKDGWTQVNMTIHKDVREEIHRLVVEKKWPLRELRRDIATLEDFFVKIVAGTRDTAAVLKKEGEN
jgi:ABC-2 type transport system ATP-binding protein